jgi:ATP adenylyltransferase
MFWSKANEVSTQALLSGSLMPISTDPKVLIENGISYYLHLKNDNSKKKFAPKPKDFNPFLPYDEDMFVATAGEHHVCLLNKFPVLAPHLLICSNTFVEQTAPLERSDFAAWILGYDDPDVLGFYNGGFAAGASQPHRHMQLVKTDNPLQRLTVSGQLPFEHHMFAYDQLDADTLIADYNRAMARLGLLLPLEKTKQCKPYNILLTSRWMLVLPRSANNIEGIFANGINYSGHFLLTNEAQVQWLEEYGVLTFLTQCAG